MKKKEKALLIILCLLFMPILVLATFISDTTSKFSGALNLLNNPIYNVSDVTVTGNITASNVHLPSYLSTHTNATIAIATGGVWHNVTFDAHPDTNNARFTHTYNDATNDTFIVVDTGTYKIGYGISFTDSASNPTNHVGIRLINNGVEIDGSVFEKDTTKQNAVGTIYRDAMADLTTGDEIKLQFISNSTTVSMHTEATYGDHPTASSINIYRIG